MRLATLREGGRDGTLVVVDRSGERFVCAGGVAPTLQAALDDWEQAAPALKRMAAHLGAGKIRGESLDPSDLHAPLPRAYEWVDGSAYINHIVLVRRARGAEPPETLETDPLVYQGGSGVLHAPTDPLPLPDASWGLDYEGEVCVVLGDVPRGVSAGEAERYVRLVMLCNDVTFRHLVPGELGKGFGFFNSKPATAFSPFAVTPDELGDAWHDGRVHLRLRSDVNGTWMGDPEAGPEMHFSFSDLIAHICRTRSFTAGTIVGSGTVSNEDPERGVSCLAERRMREILEHGEPRTPFLQVGDEVRIEMRDRSGRDLFGAIHQKVVPG